MKDKTKSLFEPWIAKQSERVAKDIATSVKWMVDEFLAAGIPRKLGIIGFCYGGGRVLDVLAQDGGTCFGVGVSFYGTRFEPSVAGSVKASVLFIAGDNDPLCPVSVLQEIETIIGGGGSKVMIFKGRGHGFVHRPESPEEDADAEEAFLVMRNWLYNGLILNT